jgi:hypothetical protein
MRGLHHFWTKTIASSLKVELTLMEHSHAHATMHRGTTETKNSAKSQRAFIGGAAGRTTLPDTGSR